ncbi:MAG: hypothetical protein FWE90_13485, partial [Defluviitaleaceae bacterium]|nr:hypothetical protein [Defluviitaleaceae bacterium]
MTTPSAFVVNDTPFHTLTDAIAEFQTLPGGLQSVIFVREYNGQKVHTHSGPLVFNSFTVDGVTRTAPVFSIANGVTLNIGTVTINGEEGNTPCWGIMVAGEGTLNIDGNVTASNSMFAVASTGVSLPEIFGGGSLTTSATVNVNGNITANGVTGVQTTQNATINVTGDINATGSYGVRAWSASTITVGGNIIVTDGNGVLAWDNSTVTVGGKIDITNGASGLEAGANATVEIAGDIIVDGISAYGIWAQGGEVTVGGEITVIGDYTYGINSWKGNITVDGVITVDGNDARGIYGYESVINAGAVNVNGNNAHGIEHHLGDIIVTGNVTASGINAGAINVGGSKVTVGGTVSATGEGSFVVMSGNEWQDDPPGSGENWFAANGSVVTVGTLVVSENNGTYVQSLSSLIVNNLNNNGFIDIYGTFNATNVIPTNTGIILLQNEEAKTNLETLNFSNMEGFGDRNDWWPSNSIRVGIGEGQQFNLNILNNYGLTPYSYNPAWVFDGWRQTDAAGAPVTAMGAGTAYATYKPHPDALAVTIDLQGGNLFGNTDNLELFVLPDDVIGHYYWPVFYELMEKDRHEYSGMFFELGNPSRINIWEHNFTEDTTLYVDWFYGFTLYFHYNGGTIEGSYGSDTGPMPSHHGWYHTERKVHELISDTFDPTVDWWGPLKRPGYVFVGWTTNLHMDSYVNETLTLTAQWLPGSGFSVTPAWGVTGVSVQNGPAFASGATVTLNVAPPSGQRLAANGISARGAIITNVAGAMSVTFTMPANTVWITGVRFENIPQDSGSDQNGGGGITEPPAPPPPAPSPSPEPSPTPEPTPTPEPEIIETVTVGNISEAVEVESNTVTVELTEEVIE